MNIEIKEKVDYFPTIELTTDEASGIIAELQEAFATAYFTKTKYPTIYELHTKLSNMFSKL